MSAAGLSPEGLAAFRAEIDNGRDATGRSFGAFWWGNGPLAVKIDHEHVAPCRIKNLLRVLALARESTPAEVSAEMLGLVAIGTHYFDVNLVRAVGRAFPGCVWSAGASFEEPRTGLEGRAALAYLDGQLVALLASYRVGP
ncbi:MAG TPA: hypothetical protein VFS09_06485 [Candidatus Eisenbacteria bacterium]|nr:hypothetical protein [Candidatus Eisenbacteria bacterium]